MDTIFEEIQKDPISFWTSTCAALLQVLGYVLYAVATLRGENRPNPAAWMLWGIGNLFDLISYDMVAGDWVKNLLPIACALSAIGVFVITCFVGKWSIKDITPVEWVLVSADVVIVALSYLLDAPHVGHVLMCADAICVYIFVVRDCHEDSTHETPAPWVVWTCAYLVMGVAVLLRFDTWWALLYPCINVLMCAWVYTVVLRGHRTILGKV